MSSKLITDYFQRGDENTVPSQVEKPYATEKLQEFLYHQVENEMNGKEEEVQSALDSEALSLTNNIMLELAGTITGEVGPVPLNQQYDTTGHHYKTNLKTSNLSQSTVALQRKQRRIELIF
jgi:peptide methionine sulfoxide reductase MsrA